jgi:Uma2 family endonuclease
MSTIHSARKAPVQELTVADLQRRFGPIPFHRIRQNPPPGSGTVDDVIRLNDHEDRLYELVDGILVEKTVGFEESWLAVRLTTLLTNFVDPQELGLVTGEGGMMQIEVDLVRIPDASFISWERLPGNEFPDEPVPRIVPDLAVEVISQSNTRKEMEEKLKDYFEKGVRLVWLVRPRSRVVDVYTRAEEFTRLGPSAMLDGGDVLPGFSVLVGDLFKKPNAPGRRKPNGKRRKD